MLVTCYKRGFLNMMEIYNSNIRQGDTNFDIQICYKNIYQKRDIAPMQNKEFQSFEKTLVIDLQQSKEKIFSDIGKNGRYKINRAIKRDDLSYHYLLSPNNEQIREFEKFFNYFAKNKRIAKCNFSKLKDLRDQNALAITFVTNDNDTLLCYHVYIKNGDNCYMLHSASRRFDNPNMKSLIGRANRFLHWKDIQLFKDKGFRWYDFGGLFIIENTNESKNINRFKKEFGGREIDVDKRIYTQSLLGKIVVFLFKIKKLKQSEFGLAKRLITR